MSRLWFLFIADTKDTDNSFGKMSKACGIASVVTGTKGVRHINPNTIPWEKADVLKNIKKDTRLRIIRF